MAVHRLVQQVARHSRIGSTPPGLAIAQSVLCELWPDDPESREGYERAADLLPHLSRVHEHCLSESDPQVAEMSGAIAARLSMAYHVSGAGERSIGSIQTNHDRFLGDPEFMLASARIEGAHGSSIRSRAQAQAVASDPAVGSTTRLFAKGLAAYGTLAGNAPAALVEMDVVMAECALMGSLPSEFGNLYSWYNDVLVNNGRFEEADLASRKAAELYGSAGAHERMSIALSDQGIAQRRLGNVAESLRLQMSAVEAALEWSGKRPTSALSTCYHNLSFIQRPLGYWDDALESASRAVSIAEKCLARTSHKRIIRALGLGHCQLATGRYQECAETIDDAIGQMGSNEPIERSDSIYRLQGMLFREVGRHEDSLALLGSLLGRRIEQANDASSVQRSSEGRRGDVGLTALELCKTEMAMGRVSEAEVSLQIASDDLAEVYGRGHYLFAGVLELRGDLHASRGERDAAISEYQSACSLISSTLRKDHPIVREVEQKIVLLQDGR